MSEIEWRLQLTSLIAEVKTNQENLHKKLDTYIEKADERVEELEDVVYGTNGTPGLSEEMRNVKGKWAALFGVSVIIATAVINGIAKAMFGN